MQYGKVWKLILVICRSGSIWKNPEFLNINVSYKQSVKVLKFSDHFNKCVGTGNEYVYKSNVNFLCQISNQSSHCHEKSGTIREFFKTVKAEVLFIVSKYPC